MMHKRASFTPLPLLVRSTRWKATSHNKKDDIIPPFIGDTGRGLIEAMDRLDLRMQAAWTKDVAFESEEDSPQYFADRHPRDLIFRIDVSKAGKVRWPLVPETDVRNLSNKEWCERSRQQRCKQYCNKYGLAEIFPSFESKVNLNVRYSNDFWNSVFFGNFLPSSLVQAAPSVLLAADATTDTPADSLFTLVMFTPDYPFRTAPEEGHLLHWVICNLPMGGGTSFDTVVDYMPPLPTEYSGHFRYVFALFRQDKGKILLPATGHSGHYPLESRRNFFLHGNRLGDAAEDRNLLAVQKHLSSVPDAVTFFHSSYDIEVTEYYQKHQLQEPVFTPQPVLEKLLMYEKYHDRDAFQSFHKMPAWNKIWPSDLPRRPADAP
eukprot:GGOE01013974.1.p1 GENE.GGOE01013974.1~~GGOE01013974.1.p1  ORF type:complete len:377 (-),score=52.58 GGOE01013974.1:359-1489(-)